MKFLALLLLTATPAIAANDAARLHQLFASDYARQMREAPETATMAGLPGENDRWTDLSPQAIAARRAYPAQNMKVLDAIDRAQLSEADQLNYDLFRWRTAREMEGLQFPSEYLQIDPLNGGVHSTIVDTLQRMPTKTVKDFEDALKRLRAAPELIDQNIALLREGVAKGITQPKIVMRDIPAQVDRILKSAPSDSVLLQGFQRFPSSISAADQDRLRRAANALVDGTLYPAMRRFRDFLSKEYLPGCRDAIALSALPNGQAWYGYEARRMNTTQLTPQQIHDIGLREVERIHGEMDKVIASAKFTGGFPAFIQFLRTDPRFYFTRAEDLVARYRDICKQIDAQLPLLFGKLPRTPYGVKEIDAYSAPSQTTAFYEPGPVDGSRSGTYRVNTYKLESRPKFEMEVLSIHESVPGHHLQIAMAHEIEGVPEFRKELQSTAFVEGWGLYSESLGYEIGLYGDPYSRFGQLSYDMWRACRLVVDTGMHSLGWSRQRAIDYMKANTALTEQNIVVEVDRYISWPGQATAYKIGQLKIRELRTRAEGALGPKFDVRKFHDMILSAGALPLDVLETRANAWIEASKQL